MAAGWCNVCISLLLLFLFFFFFLWEEKCTNPSYCKCTAIALTTDLRRGLVLTTKVLQNLANKVMFTKEPHMEEMNAFLKEQMPAIERLFDDLAVIFFHLASLLLSLLSCPWGSNLYATICRWYQRTARQYFRFMCLKSNEKRTWQICTITSVILWTSCTKLCQRKARFVKHPSLSLSLWSNFFFVLFTI